MIELILLLSVILLDLLVGNERVDKWLSLEALLLFPVMLSVGILISVAIYLLLTIGTASAIREKLESLPLLGIVVVISMSLLLYFLLNLTTKKIVSPIALMKTIKYYIQWVLTYVIIYQMIFDQFTISSEVKNMLEGTINEPVTTIIAVLSSFISTWVAVILFRIHMEELQPDTFRMKESVYLLGKHLEMEQGSFLKASCSTYGYFLL